MLGKLISSLLLVCFIFVGEFTGKVVKISDGDTIEVLHNGNAERIRLYGIDCPEISHQAGENSQPFGQVAKQLTKELVAGQEVKVIIKDTDRYGRTVAIVVLPDGRILNEELLKAGLAWHYKKYDSNPAWQKMEDDARASRKGLWADKSPISPADWRHQGNASK
jgi:endonuclease YncB( thermonuclease family)